jgi:hypothetical protein
MKATTMVLVVVAQAAGVPLLVAGVVVLWSRLADWGASSTVRRRRGLLGVATLYAVIGVLWVIGSEVVTWGWIYLAMGTGTFLIAWWEGRKARPS